MAVREKTRESRPSEPAKLPPVTAAVRAPVADARTVSKRPLVDAHKGDPAARARASVALQQQAGNARTAQMMSRAETAAKPSLKLNVAPPTVVKAPTTSQSVPKPAVKETPKPQVTTQVSLTTPKAQERTTAVTPEKEKPAVTAGKGPGPSSPATPAEPAPVPPPGPPGAPEKSAPAETSAPTAAPDTEKKEAKTDDKKKDKSAEGAKGESKEAEKPAAPSPRQAVGPAIAAVQSRAKGARKKSPQGAAIANAEDSAKDPAIEQQRGADGATVNVLATKANEAPNVQRDEFRKKLEDAIERAMGTPKTESEAARVMKQGAKNATTEVNAHLSQQRETTEKPLREANTVEGAAPEKEQKVDFKAEEVGPPPEAVSAAPVVPESLPPERLDCSSDREPTDQAMAENNVSKEQLEKGNEPEFQKNLGDRSEAEAHEASIEPRYRETETKVQHRAHAIATKELSTGLGGMHGSRDLQIGKVVAQQTGTKDKSAAERLRITNEITSIKNGARDNVQKILREMEEGAPKIFADGLKEAEKLYGDVFDEEKGGIGTWLTTWGDDWEELIENSLATAKSAYKIRARAAIIAVADFVDGKLGEARKAVDKGRQDVQNFVDGLQPAVKKFGVEAQTAVDADFAAMDSEIDERRDALVNNLVDQYKASYERMSAMEEKLREENKSLWRRIYDATIGLIKKIIAFKDMLVSILRKAADLIIDIITDPIGFLGNLIDGVMLGLNNFMSNIGKHLLKGLMAWLFGALGAAGLEMPETFDLKGIVSIILQILGLTYANFRKRAVAIVGEPIVKGIEKTAEVFNVVFTEGIPGLWRLIQEKLQDLKSMVVDAIFDYLKEKILIAGVTWIIGLLNPASAFFKACKAIYDIIVFFIERGSQIVELINAIIDSVSAIVKGNIDVAAKMVEEALAKAIPVAIGFLASLLGLGDISGTIRKLIDKAQAPINKAIDWVINLAVKGVKAVGKALGFGKDKKTKEEDVTHGDHIALAKSAVSEMQTVEKDEKKDYKTLRKEKEEQAKQIEFNYKSKLDPGIKLSIEFENKEKGEEDKEIDFKVVIAPNTTTVPGAVPLINDDDFALLQMEFGDRLFVEEEIVQKKLLDKPTAATVVDQGVKTGELFVLKPRPKDTFTTIDLFSFNAAKADKTYHSSKRNEYGFDNADIPAKAKREILGMSLMSPPPPGMENNTEWYEKKALYRCVRTKKENLTRSQVHMGHKGGEGASDYWNRIGHEQTFKVNQAWNTDPVNYWGPEEAGESRGTGSGSKLFRIPAKFFNSNDMWL